LVIGDQKEDIRRSKASGDDFGASLKDEQITVSPSSEPADVGVNDGVASEQGVETLRSSQRIAAHAVPNVATVSIVLIILCHAPYHSYTLHQYVL
jgi:hypothetical protein